MPRPKKLSVAERLERKRINERMRKAMIKSDPVLREEFLRKDRERFAKRKEAGLVLSRSQMSPRERRIIQQKNLISARAYYQRKRAKAIAEKFAQLKNDSMTNDVNESLPENEVKGSHRTDSDKKYVPTLYYLDSLNFLNDDAEASAPMESERISDTGAPSMSQNSSESDEERAHQRPSVSSTQKVPRISRQRKDSSECSYRPRKETPKRTRRQRDDTSARSLRQRKDTLERSRRQRQATPERPFRQKEDSSERSSIQKQATLRHREDTPERLQKYHQKQEEKWDLIGKSLGVQLRDLDKSQRTVAHKLINDVMYYAESGLLNPACAITLGSMNQSVNQSLVSRDDLSTVTTLNVYETEDVKENILVFEDPLNQPIEN